MEEKVGDLHPVDVSFPYRKGVGEVEIISFRTGRVVKGKVSQGVKMYRLLPARYLLWRAGRTTGGYDISVSVVQVGESGHVVLFTFDLWKGVQVRSLRDIPLRIRVLLERNADVLPFFEVVSEGGKVIGGGREVHS
ncbi:MAG: hypothetical protein QXX12_00280 [Nanopusillaceae archaeon]